MAFVELTPIRVDAERARAFVLAHGSTREIARLEGIFGAVGPARTVIRDLEALQNADGGFAVGETAGGPSGIDATCYVLHQLKELPPLAGSPMASRAVAYLRRCQQADGSWQESAEAAPHVGPWAQPENPVAALYLTALAAYTILTLEPGHIDPVTRAAAWLRRSLVAMANPAEIPTQTVFLAWGLFCRLWGPGAYEVGWCWQQLQQRQLDASDRAWGLACALEVGAGGPFLISIVQALAALAALQGEDGAWPAEPGFALESTLTALWVFRGYGII